MILIKKIEYLETDRDPFELISYGGPYGTVKVLSDKGAVAVPVSQVIELVKGRYFTRPDGIEINVGLSKQAAGVLGLQYEAWNSMEENLRIAERRLASAHRELSKAKTAGF